MYKSLSYDLILDFKSKEDNSYKGMHNLCGIFTKKECNATIEGRSMYCFSMVYPNKSRLYYCEKLSDYNTWLQTIQRVTGYEDLNETYEIQGKLGNGKFGLVKVCKQKLTGRDAAIKIMSKKNMSLTDIQLIRSEIEILKICQHPNIIKLYDILENQDYIYISKSML